MIRNGRIGVLLMLSLAWCVEPALAQPRQDNALRADVERAFDVLPLRGGIALVPKDRSAVRSVDVTAGTIAVDGVEVSGSELRRRLGPERGIVLGMAREPVRAAGRELQDVPDVPHAADRCHCRGRAIRDGRARSISSAFASIRRN